MRRLADAARVEHFLEELGRCAPQPTRIYLTGGVTAVLRGWPSTIDDCTATLPSIRRRFSER